MFVYGWSVLELRFGLLILSFYRMGSFVLKVGVDSRSEDTLQRVITESAFKMKWNDDMGT